MYDAMIKSGKISFASSPLEGNIIKPSGERKIQKLQIYYDSFEKEELLQLLSQAGIPHKVNMEKDQLIQIMKENTHKGGKLDTLLKIPIIRSI